MILGIYGTGGSGRVLNDLILRHKELAGTWNEVIFIDDTKPEGQCDERKMMPFDSFKERYNPSLARIVIAVGEPADKKLLRLRVADAGYKLGTIISPLAEVSTTAEISDGVVIESFTKLSPNVVVEENSWIQSYNNIGHDTHIGKDCQISVGTVIAGRVMIEENTFIGINAAIREDVRIGKDSIISMGAVVLKDVADEMIAMGNPARTIKKAPGKRVFQNR